MYKLKYCKMFHFLINRTDLHVEFYVQGDHGFAVLAIGEAVLLSQAVPPLLCLRFCLTDRLLCF